MLLAQDGIALIKITCHNLYFIQPRTVVHQIVPKFCLPLAAVNLSCSSSALVWARCDHMCHVCLFMQVVVYLATKHFYDHSVQKYETKTPKKLSGNLHLEKKCPLSVEAIMSYMCLDTGGHRGWVRWGWRILICTLVAVDSAAALTLHLTNCMSMRYTNRCITESKVPSRETFTIAKQSVSARAMEI